MVTGALVAAGQFVASGPLMASGLLLLVNCLRVNFLKA